MKKLFILFLFLIGCSKTEYPVGEFEVYQNGILVDTVCATTGEKLQSTKDGDMYYKYTGVRCDKEDEYK